MTNKQAYAGLLELANTLKEPRYVSDEVHARTPDAALNLLSDFRRERNEAAEAISSLLKALDDAPTWETVLALVRAADEAAEWIKDARALARDARTLSSLPGRKNTAPGARGEREMRNLRAAIRKARAALNSDAPLSIGEGL